MRLRAAVSAALLITLSCSVPSDAAGCPPGSRMCGGGCTPPLGWCGDNRLCYDRRGRQLDCSPAYDLCGGVACDTESFCGSGGRCVPSSCSNWRQFACPGDTSPLRSAVCANPNFTDCYRSEHFECSMGGPQGALNITCKPAALASGASAAARTVRGLLSLCLVVATLLALLPL